MSIIGTGVAAGVAQTGLQAQQVGRQRDRTAAQTQDGARRIEEMVEAHLRALEEGDEAESLGSLHVDGQLPDHQSPSQGNKHPRKLHGRDQAADQGEPVVDQVTLATDAAAPQAQTPPPADKDLYRHLDVRV